MTDYVLTSTSAVLRKSDQAFIPDDPANSDWREYLDWLAAGGVPDPYIASPPPKLVASARQVRLALNQIGLRQAIEDYVASQGDDVKDSWEYSTEFDVDHPFIVAGKAALGITDEQVSALFELARTL